MFDPEVHPTLKKSWSLKRVDPKILIVNTSFVPSKPVEMINLTFTIK